MAVLTGANGKAYAVNDITVFAGKATTEIGATMVYQIDDVDMRIWDPNVPIVISAGAFDKSYYDNGVNWFEGKVKLLTTGEGALTVGGSYITIQKVAEIFGWALALVIGSAETTELGDTWKTSMPLGKSATVTLSRYRSDHLFDLDDSGYQEVGLTGKTLATDTGLATTTDYSVKINTDLAGVVEYDILTAADVTYAAVIALLNAELVAHGIGTRFSLENGDLRCTSPTGGPASSIALSAGTTNPDLFATLTGWVAFNEAVAGSYNTKYFLLKLYEDTATGVWVKAIRTSFGLTKAINAIDQEALSFQVSANVVTFA